MNRLLSSGLTLVLSLSLTLTSPTFAQTVTPLGRHTVRAGETLYCLGRAYGVAPKAIAAANGLNALARLGVGQVLTIPDARWERVPAGPVCAAQFTSPYAPAGATITIIDSTSAVAPPPTPTPATAGTRGDFRYVVQRGNTLYSIGRWFGATVTALKTANGLARDVIYPGQSLLVRNVSCDPAYPSVCLPPSPPDLDCPQITAGEFAVLAPDPHRFDADGDGVGCEDFDGAALPPSATVTSSTPAISTSSEICDPAYPDVCIPPYPPDLDCGQIPYRRFRVLAPDPHNFDGDGDGIGCEG